MSYTGFRNLGSERYKRALHLLKQNTTGVFTKKQGFDVLNTNKLTKSQKSKIRRYWKQYDRLTSRPHEPIKIKDPQKLRDVQKASFHTHYLGRFNKAFVPSDGKTKPVIKYDKKTKEVFIRVNKITRKLFLFNQKLLATNPRIEVDNIIKDDDKKKRK